MNIYLALGSYPGFGPTGAMMRAQNAADPAADPVFGPISCDRVQICPQNCIACLDENEVGRLRENWPSTRFRLHANVKVLRRHRSGAHLSALPGHRAYFSKLARISRLLEADAYVLHAGLRRECSLETLFSYARQLEDLFEIPVGIEGMYPVAGDRYLISSWDEYRQLYESGVSYAVDLSHLNILATQTGRIDRDLVEAMVSSPRCLEVHVSHNDGVRDSHLPLDPKNLPWWMPVLDRIHSKAAVFYEGRFKA